MIFIAYNYFKYKLNTNKSIEYKNYVINKINETFPNEEYLLPYSQYSREELSNKLNCHKSDLVGTFFQDLPLIISKCNKLVFFPSDSLHIGSCVNLEIIHAQKNRLPVFGFDAKKNMFSKEFILTNSEFVGKDKDLSLIFYKKVQFI